MKLSLSSSKIPNIAEIWADGDNVLRIHTKSGRKFKIIASRNIYSGGAFKYQAMFEELTLVQLENEPKTVWISLTFEPQGGDTIEHCLDNALQFINDEIG